MNNMSPVSCVREKIRDQLEEIECIEDKLSQQEYETKKIIEKGRKKMEKLKPSDPVRVALNEKVNSLEGQCQQMTKDVASRKGDLKTVQELAQKFQSATDGMSAWLQIKEDKLSDMEPPTLMKDKVSKQAKDIQSFQNEIVWKSSDLNGFNQTGKSLLEASEADHVVVQDKLDDVNDRWKSLNTAVEERVKELESVGGQMSDFQDTLRDLQATLKTFEDKLASYKVMAATNKESKILDRIMTLQDDVVTLKSQITDCKEQADEIINSSPEGSDTSAIQDDMDEIVMKYSELASGIEALIIELETGSAVIADYQKSVHELGDKLSDLEDKITSQPVIGRDMDMLQQQMEDAERLLEEAKNEKDALDKMDDKLQALADEGTLSDLEPFKARLDSLKKQHGKITDQCQRRKDDIQSAVDKMAKFRDMADNVCADIEKADNDLDEFSQIAQEEEQIKEQMEDFKNFKAELEPLQSRVGEVTRLGNSLIQTAPPGVDTTKLENDVDGMNAKMNDLNRKAAQTENQLESALLQCGKFKDAFSNMMDWLNDAEGMVANQGPPSAEYQVIKAQVQEQKFLQKMLHDRASSVESLQDMAAQLLTQSEDESESETLQPKLEELEKRWSVLTKKADDREAELVETLAVAKDFFDKLQPIIEWLEKMGRRLSVMDAISTDPEKIQVQIDVHKTLNAEISQHKPDVDEVILKGHELLKHTSGEEAEQLKEKIDDLRQRYEDLNSKSSDGLKSTEEALPMAIKFHEAHGKLMDWMSNVEPELKGRDPSSGETMEKLRQDLAALRPLLDVINEEAPQLTSMSTNEGAAKIGEIVAKDNEKFESISEQIQDRLDRLDMSQKKSVEVLHDMDELENWLDSTEKHIDSSDGLSSDPARLQNQQREQKELNNEILERKNQARDVISATKKLLRETPGEDDDVIRDKIDALKTKIDTIAKKSNDRLNQIGQAIPLAQHFRETHEELVTWFEHAEPKMQEEELIPVTPEQLKRQQDALRVMGQELGDSRPLLDKLNKTGPTLMALVSDEDSAHIQDILDHDNHMFGVIRDFIRERSTSIEETLTQSAEFSDKLDVMTESMAHTAEQVEKAEPISAHPDKLRDQISENKQIIEDLDKRLAALEAVKKAADTLLEQASSREDDEAARDVKHKVDDLMKQWNKLRASTVQRNKQLEDTLEVAEKFWDDITGLLNTIKDLQETLQNSDSIGVDPQTIKEQQDVLEAMKDDLDTTVVDIRQTCNTGDELMNLCGDPDKPEVTKNIDDLDNQFQLVKEKWAERQQALDDAFRKACAFQDEIMRLLIWLQSVEESFAGLGPIGADTDTVMQQLEDLKAFKSTVDPHLLDIENLNHQAHDLTENSPSDIAKNITEPVRDLNERWDNLVKGIAERKQKLQKSLLNLGQFQHALDEILQWMDHTEKALDDIKEVWGDVKIVEIEMAKHKVLQSDVQTHESSVDVVNEAAKDVISSEGGAVAVETRDKVDRMNSQWETILGKLRDKQINLEAALREAKGFHDELHELLHRLGEIDGVLVTSKPFGGLPDTAKEQLDNFMEIFNELDILEPRVERCLEEGENLRDKAPESSLNQLSLGLQNLRTRWDSIKSRAKDRKAKLEDAENLAHKFHEDLNKFIAWLTQTENTLTHVKPVSRIMDVVNAQIEDHKNLQKDISSHREVITNLDKTGTHLKYFSQKQDVVLIKNLLVSTHHRWEKVVSRSADRTKQLDHGFKEAKKFNESWQELTNWLDESIQMLDNDTAVSNEPDKIKQQIANHKVFQRALGAKQPIYDTTRRLGRYLKDKSSQSDQPVLQEMLNTLKTKWGAVCSKSVDRQRTLEESLLFSGQFNDALKALLDWLCKVEPALLEDQPLCGDLDTVTHHMEQHKIFQQELGKRSNSVSFVKRSSKDMLEKPEEDTSHLQSQVIDLTTKWDQVCKLSVVKQQRLEDALVQATEFNKKTHAMMDWLAEADRHLRTQGPLPDDEKSINKQIEEHKRFQTELEAQQKNLSETITLGHEILKHCHPDAVKIVKNWLSTLQSRWDEVMAWSQQRAERLKDGLGQLKDDLLMLDELMAWLTGAEATLTALDSHPIPSEIPPIEQLLKDHQDFENEMSKRQPDYDRLIKNNKVHHHPDHGNGAKRRTRLGSASRRQIPVPTRPGHGHGRDGTRTPEPQFRIPKISGLFDKWRQVWLMAMDRRRKLQDALDNRNELERMKNFDFDEWRRRYMTWMNHNKSRVMDFFRKQDRDHDGKVTREEFINGILASKFVTSRMEMQAVANIFDKDGDGYIDYKEFVAALRPDRQSSRRPTDNQQIHDEVKTQVQKCTCSRQYRIHKIGEGKYRFGESQKLRLVRILRSTVMVRVGGGWVALDEFLVKNDPCRDSISRKYIIKAITRSLTQPSTNAKGRTNLELREQFILATGVSQSMATFVPRSPGSSHSGGSQSGYSTTSYSTARTASSASGPITKIREKTQWGQPWRQQRSKVSPDNEVRQIFSKDSAEGSKIPRASGGTTPTAGRSSSRPSSRTGSRPPSRSGSLSGSRPPSRAGSDISVGSNDSGSRIPVPIKSPSTKTPSKKIASPTPRRSSRGMTSPIPRTATQRMTSPIPRTATQRMTSPTPNTATERTTSPTQRSGTTKIPKRSSSFKKK